MILTREILDTMPEGSIFKVVVTRLQAEFNPLEADLGFVCCRGGGHGDWAVYYGLFSANMPYQSQIQHIRQNGDKLSTVSKIKEICPCDESALETYRY